LRPVDVARAQATLDIVDTRLAAAAAPPAISPSASRALALIAVLLAIATGQFPVWVVGAIAFAWRAVSLTAAAGAAAAGGAALIFREHSVSMNDSQGWTALALLACGLGLLAVSIANRREPTPAIASKSLGARGRRLPRMVCVALRHRRDRPASGGACVAVCRHPDAGVAGAFAFEGRAVRARQRPWRWPVPRGVPVDDVSRSLRPRSISRRPGRSRSGPWRAPRSRTCRSRSTSPRSGCRRVGTTWR
jgi:hypothetical protein